MPYPFPARSGNLNLGTSPTLAVALLLLVVLAIGLVATAEDDGDFGKLANAIQEKRITTFGDLFKQLPSKSKASAFLEWCGLEPNCTVADASVDTSISGHQTLGMRVGEKRVLEIDCATGRIISYGSFEKEDYGKAIEGEEGIAKSDVIEKANAFLKALDLTDTVSESDFKLKDGVWKAAVHRTYKGFLITDSYVSVEVSPWTGRIIRFRDTPLYIPKSVEQNVTKAQAAETAEEYARSKVFPDPAVSVRGERSEVKQWIVYLSERPANPEEGQRETVDARLIWAVYVSNSLNRPLVVYVDWRNRRGPDIPVLSVRAGFWGCRLVCVIGGMWMRRCAEDPHPTPLPGGEGVRDRGNRLQQKLTGGRDCRVTRGPSFAGALRRTRSFLLRKCRILERKSAIFALSIAISPPKAVWDSQ